MLKQEGQKTMPPHAETGRHWGSQGIIRLVIAALILLYILTGLSVLLRESSDYLPIPYASQSEKVRVVYDEERFWSEYSKNYEVETVTANQNYVYAGYGSNEMIHVFNWDGQYCFSIFCRNLTHSSLTIRCHDERLYIRDVENYIYVIEGDQILEKYQPGTCPLYDILFGKHALKEESLVKKGKNCILDGEGTVIVSGIATRDVGFPFMSLVGVVVFMICATILFIGWKGKE